MSLSFIFIGDIVGKLGRCAIHENLPKLKKKYQPDLVFANGENAAHGKGMTEKIRKELTDSGINYFTSGNHIWRNKEFIQYLDATHTNLIRPANYPENVPGKGFAIVKTALLHKVLLINLIGRHSLEVNANNPFLILNDILKKHQKEKNIEAIIVDFHAEATSEKACLGNEFDGQVSAIIWTHTHIQTNDERILPKGTGFITDVGMVWALHSTLGVQFPEPTNIFKTWVPNWSFQVEEEGNYVLNAVYFEVEDKKCTKIEKIRLEE